MDSRPPLGDCPSLRTLVDFDSRELSGEAFEAVASHLSRCDRCSAIVLKLHDSSTADFAEPSWRNWLLSLKSCEAVTLTLAAPPTPESEAGAAVARDPWVDRVVGRYRILKRQGRAP